MVLPAIKELEAKRPPLALKALRGDEKAREKLREVDKRIADLRTEEELALLAEEERLRQERKKAEEKALADQEKAKQEYLSAFEDVLALSIRIECQLADLVDSLRERKTLVSKAYRASTVWGVPDTRIRRPEGAVNLVHDFLGKVFPDDFVRRTSKIRLLSDSERARLEAVKNPDRKVAPAKAPKEAEEPKLFLFSPVRTTIEVSEGRFVAHDDPAIRDERAREAEAAGRSVFVGGHVYPVTAFQADRLRNQGLGEFVTKSEGNDQ